MSNNVATNFEQFLNKFSEKDWLTAVESLLSQVHEVDRNAVQIWFRFYPLELFRHLEAVEDKAKAIHQFAMQGEFELKNQIDSSHNFLYGHRFWNQTKAEIEKYAAVFNNDSADLSKVIEEISQKVSESAKTEKSLTLGITAIGLMTLNQTGFDTFKNAKGENG